MYRIAGTKLFARLFMQISLTFAFTDLHCFAHRSV